MIFFIGAVVGLFVIFGCVSIDLQLAKTNRLLANILKELQQQHTSSATQDLKGEITLLCRISSSTRDLLDQRLPKP